MISFERSEKEIKEKKEQTFRHTSPVLVLPFFPFRPIATAKPFSVSQLKPHKFKRTKGKIKFYSHICSCFISADCQIHFTHATDFFRINYYKASWRSIWRLNTSEDKTYHRGGQNDSSVQDQINYQ